MDHAEEKNAKKKKSRNLTPDEAAALKIKEFEESYMNYTVSIEADTEPDENTGKPLHVDKLILTSPPRAVENAGEKTKKEIEKELEQPAGWRRITRDIKSFVFGDISFTGRNSKAALQRKENAIQVIKAFCAVEFFLDWEYFNVTSDGRFSMFGTDETKETTNDAGAVETMSPEVMAARGLAMETRMNFIADALKVYEKLPKTFNINKPPEFFTRLWGHLKTRKATKADTIQDCLELTAAAIDFANAQNRFTTIMQNNTTNKLANICAKDVQYTSDFTAGFIQHDSDPDFMALFEKYTPQKKLSPSTLQLLDMLVCEAMAKGFKERIIIMTLDEYMAARGLTHKPTARERVTTDLELLASLSISDKTILKGKTKSFVSVSVCDRALYKNSKILFAFGPTFFEMLQRSMVSPYPKRLFELNLKHYPYSYHLGRKIAMDFNMNLGREGREGIISVKTLLDVCHGLPTYDEVVATGKHVDQRIITPFTKNLDHLAPDITWYFCHKNGVKITDTEAEWMDYNTFIGLNVAYKIKDWPNEDERRQALIEERAKDEKRREKAMERAKQKIEDRKAEKKLKEDGKQNK